MSVLHLEVIVTSCRGITLGVRLGLDCGFLFALAWSRLLGRRLTIALGVGVWEECQ